MTNNNDDMFSYLKREICKHQFDGRVKIGAILVNRNMVHGIGFCQMKSHPFQAKFSSNPHAIFLHAETACIHDHMKRYGYDFVDMSSMTMYIARMKWNNGSSNRTLVYGNAKPCIGCARAITEFNIKEVYYTMDDQSYEKL